LTENNLAITPLTRISELLQVYPQLEDLLIELAPPFKKLKNPVLMRTVGRVTTLQQAAVIANRPLETIINPLREAMGQQREEEGTLTSTSLSGPQPDWYREELIINTIDARPAISSGDMPLADIKQAAGDLLNGEILQLITPFIPAPLIEAMQVKGYACWVAGDDEGEVRTCVCNTV